MSVISYEAFLPEVMPHVSPGCPEIIVINDIRNACIEFCEKTNWWIHEELEPLHTIANESDYEIDTLPQVDIANVLNVKHNKIALSPVTAPWLEENTPNWKEEPASTQAAYYQVLHGDVVSLRLHPKPSESKIDVVEVLASLKPTRDSTHIDKKIYRLFLEDIAAGAKARLLAMQGKDWTNPGEAARQRAVFRKAIERAVGAAAKGYSKTSLTVRPRTL